MNADGIDILHVADSDAGVGAIPHHLELDLFPAEDASLHEHLADRACGQSPPGDLPQGILVLRNAPSETAQRVSRTHHHGVADPSGEPDRLLHVDTVALSGTGSPIAFIIRLKASRSSPRRIVSTGVPSSFTPKASSTPRSFSSTARLSPVCPPIVASSPSGRSLSMIRVSTSAVRGSGIYDVGHLFVGHDRGGIVVHQNHPDPLLAQRETGLGPGIVEFGGLADHNRPRPDHQNAFQSRVGITRRFA